MVSWKTDPRWIAWNDSVNIQYTEDGHWIFKGKSCITNLGLNFLLHKDEEHEEEQREERKCSEIKRRRQKLQASHTGYKKRFRVTNGSDAPKTRCLSRLGLVKIAVIRIGLSFSFGLKHDLLVFLFGEVLSCVLPTTKTTNLQVALCWEDVSETETTVRYTGIRKWTAGVERKENAPLGPRGKWRCSWAVPWPKKEQKAIISRKQRAFGTSQLPWLP